MSIKGGRKLQGFESLAYIVGVGMLYILGRGGAVLFRNTMTT